MKDQSPLIGAAGGNSFGDSREHKLTVPIWRPEKHDFGWWTPQRRAAQAERLSWEDETDGNGHG